jgi:hypothetical protein
VTRAESIFQAYRKSARGRDLQFCRGNSKVLVSLALHPRQSRAIQN